MTLLLMTEHVRLNVKEVLFKKFNQDWLLTQLDSISGDV